MSSNELLALALAFSLLGYSIGVLILSLPLPFPGLKKWAPLLMRDSLYAALLVFSSNLILGVVPYFQSLLGVSWGFFKAWMTARISWLIGWRTAFAAILSATSRVTGGFFLYALMEPVVKMLNYSLTTLYSILSLSIIVRSFYAKLIVLGILLLSVPFRLTRGVGAYLIAFSIVFTIGLPLLPHFVTTFTTPSVQEPPSDANVVFGSIRVVTALGRPIAYPVVYGFSEGKTIFIYRGDGEGVVLAGYPDLGLPADKPFKAYLGYMGFTSPLEPLPVVPERDYYRVTGASFEGNVLLNLSSPLVLDEPYAYAIVYRSPMVSISDYHLYSMGGRFVATALTGDSFIEFRWAQGREMKFYLRPEFNLTVLNGTWSWAGLSGAYARIYLPANHTVWIRYSVEKSRVRDSPPLVNQKSFLETIGFSPWTDFTRMASNILMSWIVLPAVYLFILGAVSSALAYLIGGARSKVPLKFW